MPGTAEKTTWFQPSENCISGFPGECSVYANCLKWQPLNSTIFLRSLLDSGWAKTRERTMPRLLRKEQKRGLWNPKSSITYQGQLWQFLGSWKWALFTASTVDTHVAVLFPSCWPCVQWDHSLPSLSCQLPCPSHIVPCCTIAASSSHCLLLFRRISFLSITNWGAFLSCFLSVILWAGEHWSFCWVTFPSTFLSTDYQFSKPWQSYTALKMVKKYYFSLWHWPIVLFIRVIP